MENNIDVSIIIPSYNEEDYIEKVICSIINQKHSYSTEIFVIDGKSTDNTKQKVLNFKDDNIKFLENEKRFKPYALNIGIKKAKGRYIIIADAHSFFPDNYISTLVNYLEHSDKNVMNAGCILNTIPANDSRMAKAISKALSSKSGVGNSYFRSGIDNAKEVDTVPFGCFRKEIFDKIGYFDTDLIRNQDDEFNARIIQAGYKIVLIPTVKIDYHARENFKKLWKMYYQYGLFKPLVNKKLKAPASLRQFAPPILVLTFLISFIPYSLFLLIAFLSSFIKEKQFRLSLYFVIGIASMHLSYGIGFIKGFFNLHFLNKKPIVGSSR